MQEKLHDMIFGHDFLDVTPKAQATKVKINKLDDIKMNCLQTVFIARSWKVRAFARFAQFASGTVVGDERPSVVRRPLLLW